MSGSQASRHCDTTIRAYGDRLSREACCLYYPIILKQSGEYRLQVFLRTRGDFDPLFRLGSGSTPQLFTAISEGSFCSAFCTVRSR